MKVRLTRKLAEMIDGVDLSGRRVGEVFEVTPAEADLLIAEGWAASYSPGVGEASTADVCKLLHVAEPNAGTFGTRTLDQLRKIREGNDRRYVDHQQRRRFEDEVREELRDSRARTVVNDKTSAEEAARFSNQIRAVARLGRPYSQVDTAADRAGLGAREPPMVWQPQLLDPGTTRWFAPRGVHRVWHIRSMPDPMT